jgi:uncharacterized protein (DUF433 family)
LAGCKNQRNEFVIFCFDGRISMVDYKKYITLEVGKRSAQPCIRGLRITVYDVLNMLANGMTIMEIIDDFPELTSVDVLACLAYVADKERKIAVIYDHEVVI